MKYVETTYYISVESLRYVRSEIEKRLLPIRIKSTEPWDGRYLKVVFVLPKKYLYYLDRLIRDAPSWMW